MTSKIKIDYCYENIRKAFVVKEIAALIKRAEKSIIKAELIAKKQGIPFHYALASTDEINEMAQSPDWVNSTCSGGERIDTWEHIEGSPKETEFEYSEGGYVINSKDKDTDY